MPATYAANNFVTQDAWIPLNRLVSKNANTKIRFENMTFFGNSFWLWLTMVRCKRNDGE